MDGRVYLGLGSNTGDSVDTLRRAVEALGEGLSQIRVSSLWLSAPRYVFDQPPYYNLVIEGDCGLEPEALLDFTSAIEARFGRDRSRERPKGPRSLDIDLLLYGNRLIDTDRLVLPHPGMEERKFVLLPLVELAPGLSNPRDGHAYLECLAALGTQGIYLAPPSDYDRFASGQGPGGPHSTSRQQLIT
ncbi:MAG TPA: 2-amino-4-hydroxy-6-hydroxymethyldihydropteridine diphosphokinase [Rectinemataceae bacterium]|nr:2-amino-4-hydroxy-6-hydroxymethyldihydropteridine diphosphokinase [Rectinemataceae bacterium]